MNEEIRTIRKHLQDVRHDLTKLSGTSEAEHALQVLNIVDEKIKELNSYDCSQEV